MKRKMSGFASIELVIMLVTLAIIIIAVTGCGGSNGRQLVQTPTNIITPTNPTPPDNPVNPADPTKPTDPTKPEEPTDPIIPPVTPVQPFTPWSGIIAYRDNPQTSVARDNVLYLIDPVNTRKISGLELWGCMMKWSPNGMYLACSGSSDNDQTGIIFDRNGNIVQEIAGLSASISWMPDSSGIIYSNYLNGLYYLKISGSPLQILYSNPLDRVYDHEPVVSLDEKWVYYVHSQSAYFCDLRRIDKEKLFAKNTVYENLYSLDGAGDERIILIPTQSGKVAYGTKGIVVVFNPETKKIETQINCEAYKMRLSPDTRYLGVSSKDKIQILDPDSLSLIMEIAKPSDNAVPLSFDWSPDTDALVTAWKTFKSDGKAREIVTIWRLGDQRHQIIFDGDKRDSNGVSALGYFETLFDLAWTR